MPTDNECRLGKIDDLHDSENERLTTGHQGVNATGQYAEDDSLNQSMHVVPLPYSAQWGFGVTGGCCAAFCG